MPHTQGKPLCPQEKQLLVSVKHYFDWNVATVNRVMANYPPGSGQCLEE